MDFVVGEYYKLTFDITNLPSYQQVFQLKNDTFIGELKSLPYYVKDYTAESEVGEGISKLPVPDPSSTLILTLYTDKPVTFYLQGGIPSGFVTKIEDSSFTEYIGDSGTSVPYGKGRSDKRYEAPETIDPKIIQAVNDFIFSSDDTLNASKRRQLIEFMENDNNHNIKDTRDLLNKMITTLKSEEINQLLSPYITRANTFILEQEKARLSNASPRSKIRHSSGKLYKKGAESGQDVARGSSMDYASGVRAYSANTRQPSKAVSGNPLSRGPAETIGGKSRKRKRLHSHKRTLSKWAIR